MACISMENKDITMTENAEEDFLTINAKSSVKLKKTTRGITWDIKIVTGEANLIEELMDAALKEHERLVKKFGLWEIKT